MNRHASSPSSRWAGLLAFLLCAGLALGLGLEFVPQSFERAEIGELDVSPSAALDLADSRLWDLGFLLDLGLCQAAVQNCNYQVLSFHAAIP